jgi:hypothetical protein
MTDPPTSPNESAASSSPGTDEEIPLGQRLLDRPFLLLVACMVVMFVFFTGWGLWEIATLPEAPLP